MKKVKKARISITIQPQYLEIADKLAKREDRSRSYILNRIIKESLANNEKTAP